MQLLRQKPIQSISVKELCELAGINRGTFYSHYTDIYDLLNQLETEMMSDFEKALEPLLSDDVSELTPLRITTEVFRCLKENSDLCTVTLGNYGDKDFAKKLISIGREKCMASYLKYFENSSPKKIEYFYAFVSSGCIGLLEKWLSDGMVCPAEDVAQAAEKLIMCSMEFLK